MKFNSHMMAGDRGGMVERASGRKRWILLKGEQGVEDVGKSVQGETGVRRTRGRLGPQVPQMPRGYAGVGGAGGQTRAPARRQTQDRQSVWGSTWRRSPLLRSVEAEGGEVGQLGKAHSLTAHLTIPHWWVHGSVPVFRSYSNTAVTLLAHVPLVRHLRPAEGDSDGVWGQLPEAPWLVRCCPMWSPVQSFPSQSQVMETSSQQPDVTGRRYSTGCSGHVSDEAAPDQTAGFEVKWLLPPRAKVLGTLPSSSQILDVP